MGRPLFDCSWVASSCITSQCSIRIPSLIRRTSAAIQFTGAPKPLNRPCTITRSPSATIVPGSYFNVGGMLLMRLNTLTTRCDMSPVLNVVRGPVAIGRYVVPFVEESVKSLKNECLVLSCLVRLIEFFLARKTIVHQDTRSCDPARTIRRQRSYYVRHVVGTALQGPTF